MRYLILLLFLISCKASKDHTKGDGDFTGVSTYSKDVSIKRSQNAIIIYIHSSGNDTIYIQDTIK